MFIVLAGLLAVYSGVTGYFYSVQDKMIFPRTVNKVPPANTTKNPNMEILSIETPDGVTLHGLLLPPLDNAAHPTLLLAFGGNAHDVTGFTTFLKNEVYRQDNVAVAGVSYRGYPNALNAPSGGVPTEANIEADALQEYDVLVARFHPAKVDVIGYSLGTAVATYVAQQRPVAALALVAPFSSMTDLVKSKYGFLPVDALLKYPFDTEGRLTQMATRKPLMPLTVMYSAQDGLIPNSESQHLADIYPGTRVVHLDGKRHGDILYHDDFAASVRLAFGAAFK